MLPATAVGLAYYRMCLYDVYCSKKLAAVVPARKPSPIISSFLEIGAEETVDAAKFVAAQKMLLKQKPSKHS